jgi:DNA-binding NarL/FixJ family response regulator
MTPISHPIQRALVVEDDPSWQQILNEILTDCGLVVDIANSQTDALSLLKIHSHRLAVVDLSLSPDEHSNTDGLLVIEAAHRLDPNCQTILLTGFATVELAVSVLTEYNAFTFLRKEQFNRKQFHETIFKVLASPPSAQTQVTNQPPGTPAPSGINKNPTDGSKEGLVLVVEDDAGWRSILCELLSDVGYQALPCSSFGEALGYLRREEFDLAVIDLSLTGSLSRLWNSSDEPQNMEGYQLLAKTRSCNIPTLVVSGVASSEEIQKAYAEQSIFAYLEKQTFDRAIFRRTVKEAFTYHRVTNDLDFLTKREREVLGLLVQGFTNKEISNKLVVTTNTVKRHLRSIFEKLGVHTRSAAASKATSRPSRDSDS